MNDEGWKWATRSRKSVHLWASRRSSGSYLRIQAMIASIHITKAFHSYFVTPYCELHTLLKATPTGVQPQHRSFDAVFVSSAPASSSVISLRPVASTSVPRGGRYLDRHLFGIQWPDLKVLIGPKLVPLVIFRAGSAHGCLLPRARARALQRNLPPSKMPKVRAAM